MSQKKLQAKINILNRQSAYLEEEEERVDRYLNDAYGGSENKKFKDLQDRLRETISSINGSGKKLVRQDVGEQHRKHTCSLKLCLNYQRSKKAERDCKRIGLLVQEARTLLEDIRPEEQNEATDRFVSPGSIKDVFDKILEAVQCHSINTIWVYGESGVGKTMLVREVKKRAEKQQLFDVVVMVSVKGNPRIQDEIARNLGVSNEPTNQEASNPRKERRLTEKQVLLILDDIWKPEIYWKLGEKLPLEDENGYGLLSYKILLTTRHSPVLSDLSEIKFEVKPLEHEEAWELFEKIATYRTESRSLPFYAEEICKKCDGLPIAIATLAKALKSGKLRWKAALQKQQSHPSLHLAFNGSYDYLRNSEFHPSLRVAFSGSYDYLRSSELHRTFLLCGLMGHNAAVQDLLKCTIGLDLLPGVNSMQQAREALLNSITKLRYSSLLLDSGGNMHFDMHNLVMEFAKSIALKEVGLNKWHEMKSIEWIHLSNTSELRINQLNCPRLTFFHLSEEDPSKPIPPELFTKSGGLKVLGLTKTWSMPWSISLLNNLHTLHLDQSVLRDADVGAILGKLKNLQVLSLVGCDLEELPEQIGQLAELKLLDLSDCNNLKVVPPGVLSGLSRLEELYMRNGFNQWEIKGDKEQENKNASLSELKHLNLTALEVRIKHLEMIKEDLFSESLARYMILVGDMWHSWDSSFGSSRMLKLKLDARISSEHSVNELLKKTEELHLQGLSDVNNADEAGFQELKYLSIQDAQNVQHIINSMKPAFPKLEVLVLRNLEKMEKICSGSDRGSSFKNLKRITVEFCNELKNLFSSSIAQRNLLQLEEISVTKCSKMQKIFDDDNDIDEATESDDVNDIVEATESDDEYCTVGATEPVDENDTVEGTELKELRSLQLEDRPEIGFNSSWKRMKLSKEQVAYSSGGKRVASFSAGKLKKLIIKGCDNLECIFSSSMAQGLSMLEHLEIRKCSKMKEVIFTDNNEEEKMIFPQLNILQIEDLEGLVNFYSGNCIVEFKALKKLHVLNCPKLEGFIANTQILFNEQVQFPELEFLGLSSININQIWHISRSKGIASVEKLKNLFVEGCGNLEYLLTSSMVKNFKQLMVLKVSDCKMMEGVIKEEERMCEISFPELDTLELEDLPKLTRFYLGNTNATINESLPAASTENVENTYMISLFHEKVEFPKLKLLRLSSLNIQQIWDLSIPKVPSSLENSKISFPVQNLKKLFVEGCGKVKHLLTSSMVMSFNQLRWLKICYCEMMEAVIDSKESKEETIFFPELHTLELIKLPKLTRFYHTENTNTPFLFDEKVGFPKLKFLSLSSIDIQQIWQISIPKISLEKLSVKDCGNLKYLLLSSMVNSFEQLRVLKICDCKMMEQVIVSNELVEEEMMCESFFSKLDTLELEDLPKLARLCHGNYSKFKFSMLRQFTISKCATLKTLIGDNAVSTETVENTHTPFPFDEKVEFPRLERVIIKFMGNWSKIWDDKHDVNSCCQLNSLTVDSCEKLLNIFPFSMLERVRHKLDTLEIQNCDSLEEIFGASQPQAQTTTQPTNLVEFVPMFLFPELAHINLSKLPKLKGFVPQIHINEWPSLKQLRMHGCDEVQIFASELPSFLEIKEDDKLQIQWISKRIFLYKRSGRICYMLPARQLVIMNGANPSCWRWYKPDPRFPEVAELLVNIRFRIHGRINTRMLSPKTRYKAYLVFKLADKPIGFEDKPIEAAVLLGGAEVSKRNVYELQAESEIVGNGDHYPKERGDNWFEVELGEIESTKERGEVLEIHLERRTYDHKSCVIVQGMEIRAN